jgi:replicative DNA helicase
VNANILLDPVAWAAQVLDWHCLDEDSSVWQRKDPAEMAVQTEERPNRESKYHRPYQAEMLRCTSRRKVFRLGRQSGKTESLVIAMLFNMFTNSNFKIVLITPFQSQIDMIFKRIEDLIRSNSMLQNSIRRAVKAPNYSLELYNGSYVKGFTAGTKSGGGAASARGQPANMLVFDEADYLSPADMDAAMAIITNYPDATVWMSSTPSGKREKFYNACMSKEWKEFHYSSAVNPNWSDELELFFRDALTDMGYVHEVEANFGEQAEGVFQVQYVEAAQSEYEYTDMSPQPSWFYSIGVDWNDMAVGSTICVTGFNPANNKFYIVERAVVKRAGWTQLEACKRIMEMNRKWQPFAIYVDKGFGGTQIEVLHNAGYQSIRDPERGPNHIDSRIPRILKSYDFGSKIETRDPFTKQALNKPAKGFLVENAVRRFETDEIKYPKSDEHLSRELMGYIVKNVTPTGNLVYGTHSDEIGDHNLDALMLALVAFTLEKSSFGKPIFDERMVFSMPAKVDSEGRLSESEKSETFQQMAGKKKGHTNRSDFSASHEPGTSRGKALRLWNEPEEKRVVKTTPFTSNRQTGSPRGSMISSRGGGRGGPPRRNNI